MNSDSSDTDTDSAFIDDRQIVYLVKNANWGKVLKHGLYYITPQKLQQQIRRQHHPRAGDMVMFMSDRILGFGEVESYQHNEYAGHIVLSAIYPPQDVYAAMRYYTRYK
jgi:acid phosphatase class B